MTRKLLGVADKIAKLKDEDVEMINGYLKILKSTWRIKETDEEQIRKLAEKGKGLFKGLVKNWKL